eukprot:12938271-Alexandrium_andersonii.AAC.1
MELMAVCGRTNAPVQYRSLESTHALYTNTLCFRVTARDLHKGRSIANAVAADLSLAASSPRCPPLASMTTP